jgi:superfamily II DNA or RNA helicase
VSFERVLSEVKACFVTGLTATPRRRDGLHPAAVIYLDTSYLLKLLLEEPESDAVRRAVARESEVIISAHCSENERGHGYAARVRDT